MAWIVAVIVPPVLLLLSISVPVYHSWQLLVVKSSIQTVERAGLLDQLSGRGNDVANQSGIISVVSNFLTLVVHLIILPLVKFLSEKYFVIQHV